MQTCFYDLASRENCITEESKRRRKEGFPQDTNFPLDQMTIVANRITADQSNTEIADYVKSCKDAFLSKIYMTLIAWGL